MPGGEGTVLRLLLARQQLGVRDPANCALGGMGRISTEQGAKVVQVERGGELLECFQVRGAGVLGPVSDLIRYRLVETDYDPTGVSGRRGGGADASAPPPLGDWSTHLDFGWRVVQPHYGGRRVNAT